MKAYFPLACRSRGTKDEKGEVAYLFGVSIRGKHLLRQTLRQSMVHSVVN
jgi:hypothetical protein